MAVQTYIQGAVTIHMDQAAGADDWSQELWELLAAQPQGPSMASSHQHPPMYQLLGYVISKGNALVSAPTTGADLEGD